MFIRVIRIKIIIASILLFSFILPNSGVFAYFETSVSVPYSEMTLDEILKGIDFDFDHDYMDKEKSVIDYSILPAENHNDLGLFFLVV
jgi:hypothetical protein